MLRRRTGKDDISSRNDSNKKDTQSQTEEDRLREEFGGAKVKQLVINPPPRRSKRRNGLIFILGGLFGVLVAVFFANQQEVISLESLLDLNLDSLIDAIPQGIVRDAREFSVLFPSSPADPSTVHSNVPILTCYGNSNTNAMPSITIHLPSAYIFNRKVSMPSTPS